MTPTQNLSEWYLNHCDNDWEHSYGIEIETLDNPGWSLTVDLRGTPLETRRFEGVSIERSDSDWLNCRLKDGQFQGRGGVGNLDEIITVFLVWAKGN